MTRTNQLVAERRQRAYARAEAIVRDTRNERTPDKADYDWEVW